MPGVIKPRKSRIGFVTAHNNTTKRCYQNIRKALQANKKLKSNQEGGNESTDHLEADSLVYQRYSHDLEGYSDDEAI